MKPIHVEKFGPMGRALISIAMFLVLLSSGAMAQKAFDRIVVFGTSLSDPGNAFALLNDPANPFRLTQPLNVPPYDKLDEYLVPDRPYAKGGHHFTNGATWIEQFAQGQGSAGDVRPAFQGNSTKATNYAIGGTRAYVEPANPTPTFAYQVGAFVDRFSGTPLPNTLYVIEMGSNDVRDALAIALKALSSGDDMDTAITKASVRLQAALTEINSYILYLEQTNGANKFLILNVPDIGLVPAVKAFGQQVSGLATLLTVKFNEGLYSLPALSGVDVIKLDLFTKLRNFVADPGDFGFINVDTPCVTPNQPPFTCSKPDTYLFWDGIHPTKAAHAIIAQDAVQAIAGLKAKP